MKQIKPLKNGGIWIGNNVCIFYVNGKVKDITVYGIENLTLRYGKHKPLIESYRGE